MVTTRNIVTAVLLQVIILKMVICRLFFQKKNDGIFFMRLISVINCYLNKIKMYYKF